MLAISKQTMSGCLDGNFYSILWLVHPTLMNLKRQLYKKGSTANLPLCSACWKLRKVSFWKWVQLKMRKLRWMNGKKIKSGSEKSDMRNLRYYTTWRLDEQKSFKIVLTCTKEGYQRRSIKTFGLELKNSILVSITHCCQGILFI